MTQKEVWKRAITSRSIDFIDKMKINYRDEVSTANFTAERSELSPLTVENLICLLLEQSQKIFMPQNNSRRRETD